MGVSKNASFYTDFKNEHLSLVKSAPQKWHWVARSCILYSCIIQFAAAGEVKAIETQSYKRGIIEWAFFLKKPYCSLEITCVGMNSYAKLTIDHLQFSPANTFSE